MEVYLADRFFVFSSQIVHLSLKFADGAVYTVEFQVVPALTHAIIIGIPFLHEFNPSIDWLKYTITW